MTYAYTLKRWLLLCLLPVLSACVTATTGGGMGGLELTIQGLTSGLDANVTMTGPNSFSQTLKASTKLENLVADNYTITARDVVQSDTYLPDKREQSVIVKVGETASVTLTYTKQSASAGSLEVMINGLPAGTDANIDVTGPDGFNQHLITSSVLSNLTPGDYQLTTNAVTVGSDTYTPTPSSQTVGIAAGSKTDVTVTYAKQAPTLGQLAITITGLPIHLNAAVSVTGPNGFSDTFTTSKTFNNLPPGEYTVTASKVDGTYPYNPYPKIQTLTVVAGESAAALLAYVPTIVGNKGKAGDGFGNSVAVDGDFMVIGAPNHDSICLTDDGAAYVYQRTATGEWEFLKELIPQILQPIVAGELAPSACLIEPSGIADGDHFGYSVAMSGDTVVVGAPNAIAGECNIAVCVRAGAVYVFERDKGGINNFGFAQELIASDKAEGDSFGSSVAIDGNRILIGSPFHTYDADGNGTVECGVSTDSSECELGSAYPFIYGVQGGIAARDLPPATWIQQGMITSSNGTPSDRFGWSVALRGETAIIGSPTEDYDADRDGTVACDASSESECDLGSVYVFYSSGKNSSVVRLTASDATARSQFGSFITADEDIIVVGTGEAAAASSAYIFQRGSTATDWNERKIITLENHTTARETIVALHGDELVIALPFVDADVNGDGATDCVANGTMGVEGTECSTGAVYLFGRNQGGGNNFGFVKSFVASDGARDDFLGFAVAISDDTIVASSPGRTEDAGAVYVFAP